MLDDEAMEALARKIAVEDRTDLHASSVDAEAESLAPPPSPDHADDLTRLENLAGEDWHELDDAAIEALAGRLAAEDVAQMNTDSAVPELSFVADGALDDTLTARSETGKITFTIGALDGDAAPIPPLEPDVGADRPAVISFKNESARSQTGPTQDADATQDLSAVEKPAPITAATASEGSGEPNEQSKERKPHITLTVRKRAADSDSQSSAPISPPVSSVTIKSATEDDWHKALAHLNSDFGLGDTISAQPIPNHTAPTVSQRVEPSPAEPVKAAPVGFSQPETAEADVIQSDIALADGTEADGTEPETVIHEHAPMGQMPNMISFAGMELVEAEPDLPSATELLMAQQGRVENQTAAIGSEGRADAHSANAKLESRAELDLVEPEELAFVEDGKVVGVDELAIGPMQVIVEQLAQERATSTQATLHEHAEPDHPMVEVEEYQALKASEAGEVLAGDATDAPMQTGAEQSDEEPPQTQAEAQRYGLAGLTEITGSASNLDGIADAFYDYDDATRLSLLQTIISESLVDATRKDANAKSRDLLSDEDARELVMARFGKDRIKLADMMHDISGHRRLDMTRLLQDQGGEALVVYLYHIGMDERNTLSILLHGPDAVSHSYDKIAQLMTLYRQLYPAAALRIVTQLFGQGRVSKAVHQPIHDEGAGKDAARLRQPTSMATQENRSDKAPAFGRRTSVPDSSA